jgi:CMP/dCMP kinase
MPVITADCIAAECATKLIFVCMHSAPRGFHRIVAIDGPAASGKSSVARELARRLRFVYVNSGGIYRAITWHLLEERIGAEDIERIAQALESKAITSCLYDGESHTLIDNVDPTEHLRENRVNESVSRVSRLPVVREIVARKLHDHARSDDLVVEGRDIGSVVFPDTPYKFYVDASPDVRLQRRAAQGEHDEIALRDHADFSRPVSPLVIAKDAHVIDTSHMTVEKVVREILARLKEVGFQFR